MTANVNLIISNLHVAQQLASVHSYRHAKCWNSSKKQQVQIKYWWHYSYFCVVFFSFFYLLCSFSTKKVSCFFSLLKKSRVFFSYYTSKCAMHVIAFNALLRVFFSYLSLCLFSFGTHAVVVLWTMMMMMPMLPTAAASAFISFVVVFHPICRNSFNYLDIYTN